MIRKESEGPVSGIPAEPDVEEILRIVAPAVDERASSP
jgi:hypothetical protein